MVSHFTAPFNAIAAVALVPPLAATVYTQVGSELVSIRSEWTQTVVARELK
jgi:hypothetical protein